MQRAVDPGATQAAPQFPMEPVTQPAPAEVEKNETGIDQALVLWVHSSERRKGLRDDLGSTKNQQFGVLFFQAFFLSITLTRQCGSGLGGGSAGPTIQ